MEGMVEIGMPDTQQEELQPDPISTGMVFHILTLSESTYLKCATNYAIKNTTPDMNLQQLAGAPNDSGSSAGSFNTTSVSQQPAATSSFSGVANNLMETPTLTASRYLQGPTAILLSLKNARRPRQDTGWQNEIVDLDNEFEEDLNVTMFNSDSGSNREM